MVIPAATDEPSRLRELHCGCFACGNRNDTGLGLRFEAAADGSASAEWLPSPAFQSYPDRIHGGLAATLLDSAMVHALFARGIAGVTAELTVRYLGRIDLQLPLRVSGRSVSERLGVYLCEAEILQNGERVVKARAKFMTMTPATMKQLLQ